MKSIKKISDDLFNLATEGKVPGPGDLADIKNYLNQYKRHRDLMNELPSDEEYTIEDIKNLQILQDLYDKINSIWVLDPKEVRNKIIKEKIEYLFNFLNEKMIPLNKNLKDVLVGMEPSYLIPGVSPSMGGIRISEKQRDNLRELINLIRDQNPDEQACDVLNSLNRYLDDDNNIKK